MISRKTYRKTRKVERIFEMCCVPVTDDVLGPGVEWFTIKDKYIVSVFVKEALGDHTWWMPVKYIRLKGKETVGIITEQNNWIDVLVWQDRLRVTLKEQV